MPIAESSPPGRACRHPSLGLFCLFACLVLSGCLPSADFKAEVRLIDEDTGAPIPGALVLVGARVAVEPPMRPPYDKPVAAARGMTDSEGTLRLTQVEGMYAGEKPQDPLYKMLESRLPKLKHRVVGINNGSILVLAPGYGVVEQPFYLEGHEAPVQGWLGGPRTPWYRDALRVAPQDIREGLRVTLRLSKPKNFDKAYEPLGFDTVIDTLDLTSKVTGTSKREKDLIWRFFTEQMEYAVTVSTQSYYLRQLRKFKDAKTKDEFDTLALRRPEDSGAIQSWLARKSLELLPAEQDEAKLYAAHILKGVADEGEAVRSRHHFYAPDHPEQAFPGGLPAPQWGAVGYPDNPGNAWDWEDAQRHYREGNKPQAYEALGHVLRLLANLALPRYARVAKAQDAELENAILDLMEKNGNELPPDYWWHAREPAHARTPRERFDDVARRTAQLTQALEAGLPQAAATNGSPAGAPEVIGGKGFPPAIAQGAGLLQDFHRLMHPSASAQAPDDGGGNGPPAEAHPSTGPAVSHPATPAEPVALSQGSAAPVATTGSVVPPTLSTAAARRLAEIADMSGPWMFDYGSHFHHPEAVLAAGSTIAVVINELKSLGSQEALEQAAVVWLRSFRPGTEVGERKAMGYIHVLYRTGYEDSLPVLEVLARSTPTITVTLMEPEFGLPYKVPKFPYNEAAKWTMEEVRVRAEVRRWENELQGLPREERLRRLADCLWGTVEQPESRQHAAYRLIVSPVFSADEALNALARRVGDHLAPATAWRERQVGWMLDDVSRLIDRGSNLQNALAIFDRMRREGRDDGTRRKAQFLYDRYAAR